jgi:hypothetical protein
MNEALNPNELKDILNNPAVSAEHKQRVLQQIGEHSADPVTQLEAELLQTVHKPDLASVDYHGIHAFCSARRWQETRGLYERWLAAHFTTESSRKDLARAAESLRSHDFEAWGGALEEWRDGGWKSTGRLITVLERIVNSPNRGNYHASETVEGARKFLAEMQCRAGEET